MKFYNKQNGFSTLGLIGVVIVLLIVVFFIFLYNRLNRTVEVASVKKDILIGFSIPTLKEERWQRDKSEFLKKAEELGAVVDMQTAQDDEEKQISQIEGMVIKGVDVLVVVPLNSKSLVEVLNKAHDAGIKIIAYDRMINDAPIDMYISFDNEKVGFYEAQYVIDAIKDKLGKDQKLKVAYVGGSELDNNAFLLKKGSFEVLKPLIDKGQIEIVYDKFTDGWSPDIAYKSLKEYLNKSKGKLDAVVAANDGTAFGAITALSEFGLSGKVPVSGQDAELAAAKRIIEGTQTLTVYKPIQKLAFSAAIASVSLANNIPIKDTIKINNGLVEVSSILLDPIVVTKNNIDDTLIKDGYHKREDVYKKQ